MSSGDPGPVLRGRRNECDALDRLLTSVRAGQSQVLVVRGEPGVGKSALLEYLVQRASGCRVARAAGNEYEMELAYAGLHQLCAPMLELRDRLPDPQRDALATAFGLSAKPPPDRFVVGLAVLGLLGAPDDEPIPNLAELADKPAEVWNLVHASRYSDLESVVPSVLPPLETAARRLTEEDQREAFRLLAILYHTQHTSGYGARRRQRAGSARTATTSTRSSALPTSPSMPSPSPLTSAMQGRRFAAPRALTPHDSPRSGKRAF
jgi:AAA ATPase domain